MDEILRLKAWQLKERIASKEVSALDVAGAVCQTITDKNREINAFIGLTEKLAQKSAEEIDKKIKNNQNFGLLAGIPIAIKDNICVKDFPTTCGSKILKNFVPPYDATVIKRLKEEDAIIIGKTNLDEFAMGSSNEYSFFGPVRNPCDKERTPGGSSGGSAAAVASDMAFLALCSDTGGSVRQPASFCGVVGMKPTYGLISRYGLVAFASSLDQIGPITKDVRDCALFLSVIAGYDEGDSTSIKQKWIDYTQFLNRDVKNLKVGIPREFFAEGLDKEVEEKIRNSIGILEKEGLEIKEVSLPHTNKAIATYYVIANAEASSNLARYDGVRYGYRAKDIKNLLDMYKKTRSEGFGDEVKRRIMLGTYVLSAGYYEAYYGKAQKVRAVISKDFQEVFKQVDLLITPTSPTTAFKLGEKLDDPLAMYLSDVYTVSVNLAGLPAISIPCGKDSNGLPIGLQIIGKHLGEGEILSLAHFLETKLNVGTDL